VTGILFGVDEKTLVSENYDPNSGDYQALFGPAGGDGTLSQTFATTVGDTYEVRFFMASEGGSPTDFSAMFNSTMLMSMNPVPDQFYTEYDYSIAATGSSSTLTFDFRSDPGFNLLDDVSVVDLSGSSSPTAPEQGTCVLRGAGYWVWSRLGGGSSQGWNPLSR
jgi:flagellin